jgi:hypothetical protein
MHNLIEFAVIDDDTAITVVPIIDGTSLIALVAKVEQHYVGMSDKEPGCYQGLAIDDSVRLRSTEIAARTAVLVCSDDPTSLIETSIHSNLDTVEWTTFANPIRPDWSYAHLGPFQFDRDQYEQAIASLSVPLTMG